MSIEKSRHWMLNPFVLIAVLTAFQLALALLTNGFALSQDEAMWHYIGRNWFRNGLTPYSGGVDNKSPLFFVIFGISDKIFGVNYWFPRVIGTICQSLGIYFVYRIASFSAGKKAGLLALSFYGLSVLWHGVDGRYVSYTETYDVLFTVISFYLVLTATRNKNFFIAGLTAAFGLSFRLTALFGIAALCVASFRKGKVFALFFCAGLACSLGILASLAFLSGINLHDAFIFMVGDNFGSGSTTDHDFWWRMVQFHNLFFYSEVILFYPLALVYVFLKRGLDWLIVWAIFAFIGINLVGNYARVDLKDLLPSLALMGAIALAESAERYQWSMRPIMVIVWLCFSPKIVEPFLNFQRLFTGEFQKAYNFCHEPFISPDESASRQLGWWLRDHTTDKQKVFVAGYGAIVQTYSERISPTVYFNATQTKLAKARFYKDMSKNRADVILVPLFPEYKQYIDADLRTYVDELVAQKYRLDRCMFNYSIYRIKN